MPPSYLFLLSVVTSLLCGETIAFSCRNDEFECDEGSCISVKYLCDHEEDCPNREDEIGCPKCPKGQFLCSSSNRTCIPSHYICDSHPDCLDGSDEHDCSNGVVSTLIPTSALSSLLLLLATSSSLVWIIA